MRNTYDTRTRVYDLAICRIMEFLGVLSVDKSASKQLHSMRFRIVSSRMPNLSLPFARNINPMCVDMHTVSQIEVAHSCEFLRSHHIERFLAFVLK